MTLETFLNHFDLLADTPNAVRAFREIILQQAVRGRVVDQQAGESSDEQLLRAEEFRKQRGHRGEPDVEDVPFTIPGSWGWVAVGDCMTMINGRAFKSEEWSSEGTPIIRIQNLNNPDAPFNYCKLEVDPKVHVHDGEFLISWSGTPGTSFGAFIWSRGFAYLNQHIFRCDLVKGVFVKEFLRLAINARLDEMISHAQGGVGLRHITKGKLESIRLPLPPFAEQKRIVAKVDELMALCDQLEAQQHDRCDKHTALSRAAIARFDDAPTAENLRYLTHGSYTIGVGGLRRTILSLAMEGRLVPRDPRDEHPRKTFPRLAAFAKQLAPGEGPEHWLRTPFGSFGDWCGGGTPSKSRLDYWNGRIPWVSPKDMKQLRIGDAEDHISSEAIESCSTRLLPTGSVLMVVRGMILARAFPVAISTRKVTINQDMKAMTPCEPELAEWALLVLRASEPTVLGMVERSSHGTCKLDTAALQGLLAPVPPLAEQHRIIAKVDELMALVDQLEGYLDAARDTGERLMDAAVAELTQQV